MKPTCATCPHAHKPEPKLSSGLAILQGSDLIECRGMPIQGRIIRGDMVALYTITEKTTPACALHPDYVPARPAPGLKIAKLPEEEPTHEQLMTPPERAVLLDKWGDGRGRLQDRADGERQGHDHPGEGAPDRPRGA